MSNGLDRFGRPHEWGWDPQYWETRPGHWGPPGIFLPPPLARAGARYPLNPASLQRMMGVPITYLPQGFQWAFYSPQAKRLFMPPDIPPAATLHEYGHTMQPPGFAPAYRELMETGEYPAATYWYDLTMSSLPGRIRWAARKALFPGAAEAEGYADYPRLHFTPEYAFTRTPEELRQYYPWLRWGVPRWTWPEGVERPETPTWPPLAKGAYQPPTWPRGY